MRFYCHQHPFYCGIDLHARNLYVCIIDDAGEIIVHKNINANPNSLLALLEPYIGNVVVGVECMHCWYWVADFCEDNNIDFVLGHALYMNAIHKGKTKNDKIDSFKIASLIRGGNFPIAYHYPKEMRATRDLMRRRHHFVRQSAQLKAHVKNSAAQYNLDPITKSLRDNKNRQAVRDFFPDLAVQKSIDANLDTIEFYNHQLASIEFFIEKRAKQHNPQDYYLLKTIPGIGKIIALSILYEIGDISRFPSVKQFASYARLVKCQAESAGKIYGTKGNKIGNAHLKWAFSEAAVLYLKGNPPARKYLDKLQRRMSKSKALTVLAHKLGRCIYYMLKNRTVFDESRLLNC